ncbi:MAG TPA: putative LPS assembly protein LptD [Gemmatimonadales bacterium]|jgi:hypothetical protein
MLRPRAGWLWLAGLLLTGLPARATAQITHSQTINVDTLRGRRADSLRGRTDSLGRDTTHARGSTIPKNPSRSFPTPDSILAALLKRKGFQPTRYMADSVRLLADEKQLHLAGHSLISREGSILEADTVRYAETSCALDANGSPRLFDPTGTMIGTGMRYDACNHAGIVQHATTEMAHGGGTWHLRGDIAIDNQEDRIYAANATMTSCDLVDPHYHFAVHEVKWVSKRLMVSRPAILYVADVPVAWLPFVFQDTRRGRRSGILPPEFGINDIVRFNPGYHRHLTNLGYYWAISDYADAQASIDWYADQFTTINGRIRYRWLNHFLAGGLAFQNMHIDGGGNSMRLSWSHSQQFSLASSLNANLDYATSSSVISQNAVDPILAVGTIDSRLNYQHRFAFGQLNVGGSRTQSLNSPQVTATFPTLAFTPNPISLSHLISWSPSMSFTNSLQQNSGSPIGIQQGPGLFDSLRTDSRTTSMNVSTPFRIGQWSISAAASVNDEWSNSHSTVIDTLTHSATTAGEDFSTQVDWNAGVGLPILLQGRWNVQPSVNMVNTSGGSYLIRNPFTHGGFVAQGKRFQFGAGISPTFFGFFPGFGPMLRIRHAFSPIISWAYSPSADIPRDYAIALNHGQLPLSLIQPARQSVSIGLSQSFEAKLKPPAARPATQNAGQGAAAGPPGVVGSPAGPLDTTAANARDTMMGLRGRLTDSTRNANGDLLAAPEGRKIKLLSIQSDAIGYDFEQAKLAGHTGWTTQTWGNTISSDLLRGFSLRFSHDLWQGQVGSDTARFKPFLTSMAFSFSLSGTALNAVRKVLGLSPQQVGGTAADSQLTGPSPTNPGGAFSNAFRQGPLATQYTRVDQLSPVRGGQPFQAQLSYSLQRARPVLGVDPTVTAASTNSMLTSSVQFSPTPHWTVSWQTSYNFTQGQFADHVVRLDRDLHDWRATFTFVKSPNGNFLFNFFLQLIDEPDLKFGYDQRNVR